MAGGRKKRTSKLSKTNAKIQQLHSDSTADGEEKALSTINNVQEIPIKKSLKGSPKVESKYVPPFSRNTKSSCRDDDKDVGKSPSRTSQRLKRRLAESSNDISPGKLDDSLKDVTSKDEIADRNQNPKASGITKQSKMLKLSRERDASKDASASKTASFPLCDPNSQSNSSEFENTSGDSLKQMEIVQNFVEKIKKTQSFSEISVQVEATPKDKMADKTGPPSTQEPSKGGTIGHSQLPGVDQLVKACVSYLIDRVDETKEGESMEICSHAASLIMTKKVDGKVQPKHCDEKKKNSTENSTNTFTRKPGQEDTFGKVTNRPVETSPQLVSIKVSDKYETDVELDKDIPQEKPLKSNVKENPLEDDVHDIKDIPSKDINSKQMDGQPGTNTQKAVNMEQNNPLRQDSQTSQSSSIGDNSMSQSAKTNAQLGGSSTNQSAGIHSSPEKVNQDSCLLVDNKTSIQKADSMEIDVHKPNKLTTYDRNVMERSGEVKKSVEKGSLEDQHINASRVIPLQNDQVELKRHGAEDTACKPPDERQKSCAVEGDELAKEGKSVSQDKTDIFSTDTDACCRPKVKCEEKNKIPQNDIKKQGNGQKTGGNITSNQTHKTEINLPKLSKDLPGNGKQLPSVGQVDEEMDYEFLMDCTDSQLMYYDGLDGKDIVSENDIEDGSLLINELMQEISSLKQFLQDRWNKSRA